MPIHRSDDDDNLGCGHLARLAHNGRHICRGCGHRCCAGFRAADADCSPARHSAFVKTSERCRNLDIGHAERPDCGCGRRRPSVRRACAGALHVRRCAASLRRRQCEPDPAAIPATGPSADYARFGICRRELRPLIRLERRRLRWAPGSSTASTWRIMLFEIIARSDHRGSLLRHHDDRGVDIADGANRHHRSVDDSKSPDTSDSELRIDN